MRRSKYPQFWSERKRSCGKPDPQRSGLKEYRKKTLRGGARPDGKN
ncbi:hypothetical protein HMPREF9554_00209 [Treponema phagedenis F0421]|nr:hypothetical protein HMPREF9554_00209 [Treponema phagedenis F0421]